MGERLLRPGVRTSDRTAALVKNKNGGWMAQVFYDWLLTVVDDFGRYDARPGILRTAVFPLLLDIVRETDIQRCLKSCEAAELVRLYNVDEKPFLEVLRFRQRTRAKNSKYPPPPLIFHDNVMTLSSDKTKGVDAPPQVSLPPITPISSSPSPIIITASDSGKRELSDREIREWFGTQKMLIWNAKDHSRLSQMIRIGGWPETIADVETSIAYTGGGDGTISYALTTMMNRHAKKASNRERKIYEKPKAIPGGLKIHDSF